MALVDQIHELLAIGDGVEVQSNLPGARVLTSSDLRFSGRLFARVNRTRAPRNAELHSHLDAAVLNEQGWTKAEFNSVFTREILEEQDVVLPVWHNVSARDVYEHSPSLANRVAAPWSVGEAEVIRRLRHAIVTD